MLGFFFKKLPLFPNVTVDHAQDDRNPEFPTARQGEFGTDVTEDEGNVRRILAKFRRQRPIEPLGPPSHHGSPRAVRKSFFRSQAQVECQSRADPISRQFRMMPTPEGSIEPRIAIIGKQASRDLPQGAVPPVVEAGEEAVQLIEVSQTDCCLIGRRPGVRASHERLRPNLEFSRRNRRRRWEHEVRHEIVPDPRVVHPGSVLRS